MLDKRWRRKQDTDKQRVAGWSPNRKRANNRRFPAWGEALPLQELPGGVRMGQAGTGLVPTPFLHLLLRSLSHKNIGETLIQRVA